MTIKRYDPEIETDSDGDTYIGGMEEHDDGKYVKFADHQAELLQVGIKFQQAIHEAVDAVTADLDDMTKQKCFWSKACDDAHKLGYEAWMEKFGLQPVPRVFQR